MRITKYGLREISISASVAVPAIVLLALFVPGWWRALVVVPLVALAWVVLFFRDPERDVPEGDGLLVSPADGTIAEIADVTEETYLKCEATKIGIFMSIFNAHINRSPVSGRVEYVKHTRGKFLDARDPASSAENESNAIGMEMNDREGRILVKQISGAIARRIVCECRAGQALEKGGRIGMIKFGSRTEVFVPKSAAFKVLVKIGDRVKAGSSVLGEFE